MALTKCKECGEQISTKAAACPKCGAAPKKSTSVFTWVVAILIGLWVVGSILGKDSSRSSSTPSRAPTAPAEAAMRVDIRDILSAYNANEVGADNRFKGHLIQVTGIIDSIKKDITDSLYVTLGTGKSFEIPQIQAFFDDSMNQQLGQLRAGTQLTVVCRVDGLMMNVLAKDCFIVR